MSGKSAKAETKWRKERNCRQTLFEPFSMTVRRETGKE
jgi:hypothetical protein